MVDRPRVEAGGKNLGVAMAGANHHVDVRSSPFALRESPTLSLKADSVATEPMSSDGKRAILKSEKAPPNMAKVVPLTCCKIVANGPLGGSRTLKEVVVVVTECVGSLFMARVEKSLTEESLWSLDETGKESKRRTVTKLREFV